MREHKFFKKSTAAIAAAMLGLLGLGVFSSATAAPGAGSAENTAPIATIDGKKKGSITVHKYSITGEASEAPRTGTEKDQENIGAAEALDKAKFKIEELDYAITTADGFKAAAEATVATAKKKVGGKTEQKETADGGIAKFEDLSVGAYLLTEVETPEGHIPSEASIVFVPMTNIDRTGWNYDIHVYPKNKKVTDNPEKKEITPADKIITVGQYLTYQIKKALPAPAADKYYSEFVFVDDLSTHQYLELDAGKLKLKLEVGTGEGQMTSYSQDTDYRVETADNKLKVTLTEAGLQKMTEAARKGAQGQVFAQLTFDLKVKAVPHAADKNGVIENTATTITNNGTATSSTTQKVTPGDEAKTQFGNLKIEKVDGQQKPLAGAEFQLYQCGDEAGTVKGEAIGAGADGQETVFTTAGPEGVVTITGIRATETTKLCLVEKKAPEGYQLLPKPVEVEFTAAVVNAAPDNTVSTKVVNDVENSGIFGKLPLTGGAGVILMILLGGALLAGAVYSLRQAAKRS